MVKYEIDARFLRTHKEAIAQGKPVSLEIWDVEEGGRRYVNAILSPSQFEGGGATAVRDPEGNRTALVCYIKVIEELPEDSLVTVDPDFKTHWP